MVRNASNTIPSLVGLEFRTPPGRGGAKCPMFFCFFVCHVFFNGKVVNATSPSTRWKMETILVSLDRGMFVNVLCTRVKLSSYNAERSHGRMTKLKNGKFCDCSFLKGDAV